MAHERSIGIEVGGRNFNIPTVYNDAQLEPDEAVYLFKQGKIRPLGQYSTQMEADTEAEKRSQEHTETPPDLQKNYEGIGSFLKTLIQPTIDAYQQDVSDISEGSLPRQAVKTAGQAMNVLGNPALTPTLPALIYSRKTFDPQTGWQVSKQVAPGGDWLSLFTRQGGLGEFLQNLLIQMEKARGVYDVPEFMKRAR